MTDVEIIQGLIDRDNLVTEEFFFVRCRPLFLSIIGKVFDYQVEYDEQINDKKYNVTCRLGATVDGCGAG